MNRFADRVVVVTGGANGIGAATAELFAQEGATVIVVDTDAESGAVLEDSMRSHGFDMSFHAVSVAAEDQVSALLDHIRVTQGRVDVLFNNAGIALKGHGVSTTTAEWRRVLSVNLDGVFFMTRNALPLMPPGSAIVNTSSICGHIATAGAFSYNTSKHAVEGLTKSLALENAHRGIRVNTVCPGFVNTPMGQADLASDPSIPDRHPLGRLAEPDEVGRAVLFLASDDASFITGTSLLVDGGYTAR